jgi:hypothetical protein
MERNIRHIGRRAVALAGLLLALSLSGCGNSAGAAAPSPAAKTAPADPRAPSSAASTSSPSPAATTAIHPSRWGRRARSRTPPGCSRDIRRASSCPPRPRPRVPGAGPAPRRTPPSPAPLDVLETKIQVEAVTVTAQFASTCNIKAIVAVRRKTKSELRRLNECLEKVAQKWGWGPVEATLRYRFILVSAKDQGGMKAVARLLPLSLGLMAILFFVSDVADLYQIWKHPIRGLAFRSGDFMLRVGARLTTDLILASWVALLSFRSYKEFTETEKRLLP